MSSSWTLTHVIFVLDEVDSIRSDDDILYQLPRCNDNGNVPADETKVGVVGISNDFTFRDNLSARVKDSLCNEEVYFPPYGADQLKNILEQRCEHAFQDGVLSDDVIPLCSAMAGQESGSARQALKLVFKAGDLARSTGDERVTEQHVRDAEPLVKEGKMKDELNSLPTQSHLTLYSVWQLSKQEETPVRSTEVYEMYRETATTVDVDVKTDRTIRDRLSQLRLKGFLDAEERNKGPQGGSFFLYSLGDIRPEVIEEALRSRPRLAELFQ